MVLRAESAQVGRTAAIRRREVTDGVTFSTCSNEAVGDRRFKQAHNITTPDSERRKYPLIILPPGLDLMYEPYLPDLRGIYWVDTVLLDPSDEKPRRPLVVVAIPDDAFGTIQVVVRSTTNKNGPSHAKQPQHGLNQEGWFSMLGAISSELWTPENATSADLLLDEETFSYIFQEFDL